MARGQRAALLLAIALLAAAAIADAFKEQDFKKCATNGFCRRNRGVRGTKFSVDPKSVRAAGAELTATLRNADAPEGTSFSLTLRAYAPGVVRVTVDEAPLAGHGARYQVQDVLMPGLDAKLAPWEKPQQAHGSWSGHLTVPAAAAAGAGGGGAPVDVAVKLTYGPSFVLEVGVAGAPAVVLNSQAMFNVEHAREKKEGDPEGWWEETFNGHGDSKPSGPEAISIDLAFPGARHVYGIPERAMNLSLPPTAAPGAEPAGEPYRLYNLDVFEYEHHSPFGLYGAIPVLLAHKASGGTVGAFWLNAAEMYVDVLDFTTPKTAAGRGVQWIAESGILDLFVLAGPTPAAVTRQYAVLTGTTAMPQLFALGYHQCRWNYKSEEDALQVDAGFDEHAIPYDVLWLDIEHTNGKRYMTWDSTQFPNPADMQNDVASRGRKMVTIVDPHVKRDTSYRIHQEATEKKFYVRTASGNDFDGWCWPGASSYLDVTSREVREWWATQFTPDKYQGSTKHLYIWNDMNEPSVFNGPEITMHKDVQHAGNVEHRDVHNIFGLYYHLATAEGLIHRGADEALYGPHGDRPFVLSRAFFSGTQRIGPIWTGDNAAQWSHLSASVPMLLTLNLAGLPFSGADVGGFFGNPDAELLTRWYQLGIYYPFFRGHAHLETQRREPWLFGADTTRRIREAIRGRYALLPYLYTLFRHTNVTGEPIMRPLWYEFPTDESLFAVEEEFLLGPALLVRPVLTQGATAVTITLPAGAVWYEALGGAPVGDTAKPGARALVASSEVHLEAIPVFYRGGFVVPRRERPRRSTAAMADDPFTLVVALDAAGRAEGELYLDDGRSFAFAKGAYLHRRFSYADGVLRCSAAPVADGVPPGTLPSSKLVVERVVILGLDPAKRYAATTGKRTLGAVSGVGADGRLPKGSAVVVRAANLPIAVDWTLRVSQGGVAVE